MGVNRYIYADGDTSWYDTFVARTEKLSKGYNGLCLSNYSTAATCAIAAGSSWEQGGSGFFATTATDISGSVATGICYIYSTASTAAASLSWNQNEPVWRDDYNGYYWSVASTTRAIGGAIVYGISYYPKWVYYNRETGPRYYYMNRLYSGSSGAQLEPSVGCCLWPTSEYLFYDVNLPNGSYVVDLTVTVNLTLGTQGAIVFERSMYSGVTATAMSSNYLSSISSISITTVTNPIIEADIYKYWIKFYQNSGSDRQVYCCKIKYLDMFR